MAGNPYEGGSHTTHDHDPDHMTVTGSKASPVRCDRCQIAPRLPVAEASQRVMSVKGIVRAVTKSLCVHTIPP